MHSKGYFNRCSLIRLLRGAEIDLEAPNSLEGNKIGLVMPRPPSLGGRLRRSRSRSFGGDLPVKIGFEATYPQITR